MFKPWEPLNSVLLIQAIRISNEKKLANQLRLSKSKYVALKKLFGRALKHVLKAKKSS